MKNCIELIKQSGYIHIRIPPSIRIPPLVSADLETRGGILIREKIYVVFTLAAQRKILGIFHRKPFRNRVFECKNDEKVLKIFSRCARLSNNVIMTSL